MVKNEDRLDDEIEGKENIYKDKGVEELIEEDEISPTEAGFMEGVIHGEDSVECAYCENIIDNRHDAIEFKYKGEIYFFDSEDCLAKWKREKNISDEKN